MENRSQLKIIHSDYGRVKKLFPLPPSQVTKTGVGYETHFVKHTNSYLQNYNYSDLLRFVIKCIQTVTTIYSVFKERTKNQELA